MTRFGGRHLAMGAALAATVACGVALAPAGASGTAGFQSPHRLSATSDFLDLDDVVVAPTGRTAVMWRAADEGKRGAAWRYGVWVATGPDPAHLGTPAKLPIPTSLAREAFQRSLDVFPDGTVVACLQSDPRKGDAFAGCMFAPPNETFGAFHEFTRVSWKLRPTFTTFARPDGRLLLMTSVLAKGQRRAVSTRLLDRDGKLTPPQAFATIPSTGEVSTAATDDGLVAATWSTTDSIQGEPLEGQQLAFLQPGEEHFGAPRPLALPDAEATTVSLAGGRRLVLGYRDFSEDRPIERFATLAADGALSPFVESRRFTKKGGLSSYVLPLADGSILGVSQSFASEPLDCDTHPFSEVGVGTLAPSTGSAVTGERLSKVGQIAEYPSAAELADGTVVVVWGNAAREGSEYRLEAAVRAPGAARFPTRQVLPRKVGVSWRFAAGGNHALVVSEIADRGGFEAPEHLEVSAFTTSGPVARSGKRPAHPSTSCG